MRVRNRHFGRANEILVVRSFGKQFFNLSNQYRCSVIQLQCHPLMLQPTSSLRHYPIIWYTSTMFTLITGRAPHDPVAPLLHTSRIINIFGTIVGSKWMIISHPRCGIQRQCLSLFTHSIATRLRFPWSDVADVRLFVGTSLSDVIATWWLVLMIGSI